MLKRLLNVKISVGTGHVTNAQNAMIGIAQTAHYHDYLISMRSNVPPPTWLQRFMWECMKFVFNGFCGIGWVAVGFYYGHLWVICLGAACLVLAHGNYHKLSRI